MARKSSISKTFVWIILGLLIVGLAGFGATNLGGTLRTVGDVGDRPISVNAYAQALQNNLARIQQQTGQSVTFREAEAFGLPQQVMGQLITSRALEHEAYTLGLSIGDEELAKQLSQNQRFQGPDGTFDRQAYRFALQQAGLNEAQFEEQLRDETAGTMLQAAVIAGTSMPESYARTILSYAGETRDFTWIGLTEDSYDGELPEPTDADLRAHYDGNIDAYTLPERRQITYASVSPEQLSDTIEVDEQLLLDAYDQRSAEYNLPERRLVERLVMPSDAAATEALARITAGEALFEDVVAGRSLGMSDVDLGDVTLEDLGAAGDAVFAAEVGAVVGPLPSEFGPALFRVNARLPAQVTPFEEAREALSAELVLDRARREIGTLATQVDDLLAGGATLEEVAQDTAMELGQIDWSPASEDGIAAYDSFRDIAAGVTAEDYPEVHELDDGGIFALRLNDILPPAPEPFEDVIDRVRADWRGARLAEALTAQAEALKVRLDAGEPIDALGQTAMVEAGLRRSDFVGGLPRAALTSVFDLSVGESTVVEGDGRVVLLRLDAVHAVDYDDPEVQAAIEQLDAQAASSIADELMNAVANDASRRAGVRIDQNALNAVHTQFQ